MLESAFSAHVLRWPLTFPLRQNRCIDVACNCLFLDDFVYGLKGNNGEEWFLWLENLVYHLLILSCVYKVAAPAVKKLGNK